MMLQKLHHPIAQLQYLRRAHGESVARGEEEIIDAVLRWLDDFNER